MPRLTLSVFLFRTLHVDQLAGRLMSTTINLQDNGEQPHNFVCRCRLMSTYQQQLFRSLTSISSFKLNKSDCIIGVPTNSRIRVWRFFFLAIFSFIFMIYFLASSIEQVNALNVATTTKPERRLTVLSARCADEIASEPSVTPALIPRPAMFAVIR
jgi:hypothetical protein